LFSTERQNGGTAEKQKNLTAEPPVWNAGAIWMTFEAMRTLRRPDQEGQWETFQSSRPVAWKTGTSFGYRDAWAVGITPKYTIGVWVGNADGEGRPGVIGLHAAAPIMFDALRMLDDDGSWWSPPYDALTMKMICHESGWLATSSCEHQDTGYIIAGSQTPANCTFHTAVFSDAQHRFRYDPSCMSQDAQLTNYFVVPALAENYYKRFNPSYRTVPALHPDCAGAIHRKDDLAIVYPRNGSKIYVPYEWDKKKSRAIFSAVHRSDRAEVYWHLDKQYIGKTKEFHQIEMDPSPGKHVLVLQDEYGGMVTTSFEVLSR
jgi:penicillin-binding protein 1C